MFKLLKKFFDRILYTKKKDVYEVDEHAIDLYGPRWPAKNSVSLNKVLQSPPVQRRRRDRHINTNQPTEPIIVHEDDHSLEFLASALIIEALNHTSSNTSPTEEFSGKDGDFGGAGASGSWDSSSDSSSSYSSSSDSSSSSGSD